MIPSPFDTPRQLGDAVYRRLLDLLGSGQFAPEARLPGEIELARRFAVSRPVLRQALARLRAEGRIEARKGSGNFVRVPGPPPPALDFGPLSNIPDVRTFLEFRSDIEAEMAARAALRRDQAEIAAMQQALAALEAEIAEGGPALDADIGFHLAVARASGNRFYLATLNALAEQTRFSIRLTRELSGQPAAARFASIQREHHAIAAAIAGGNAAAARAAMAAHLRGGIQRLFG
ncbi:FadR/GntR family transcriptional regulator [Pseudoroseomonas globiformis]|uniref:FadR/GntR family transcriptional regulator n=1 Tax=Teichococcus globiformis TaxID=2307229 RepID=A0ABV7G2S8_9PROT